MNRYQKMGVSEGDAMRKEIHDAMTELRTEYAQKGQEGDENHKPVYVQRGFIEGEF
jgi:hypothetical protein